MLSLWQLILGTHDCVSLRHAHAANTLAREGNTILTTDIEVHWPRPVNVSSLQDWYSRQSTRTRYPSGRVEVQKSHSESLSSRDVKKNLWKQSVKYLYDHSRLIHNTHCINNYLSLVHLQQPFWQKTLSQVRIFQYPQRFWSSLECSCGPRRT